MIPLAPWGHSQNLKSRPRRFRVHDPGDLDVMQYARLHVELLGCPPTVIAPRPLSLWPHLAPEAGTPLAFPGSPHVKLPRPAH